MARRQSTIDPPDSITETLAYDAVKRPTSIGLGTPGSLSQAFDRAGRFTSDGRSLTGISGDAGAGTQTFTYDALSRLTGSSLASAPRTYQYDLDGNRTRRVEGGVTTDFTYDRADQVAQQVIGVTTKAKRLIVIGWDRPGSSRDPGANDRHELVSPFARFLSTAQKRARLGFSLMFVRLDSLQDDGEPHHQARHEKRRSVLASLVTNDDGSISWTRVGVGVVLAAALLGAAILVGTWADTWAAQQALIKVDKPTYVPPTSTLPAIATSLMTLAGAWSAALLALVLAAKK